MFAKVFVAALSGCLAVTAARADDGSLPAAEGAREAGAFGACVNAKFYNEGSVIDTEVLSMSNDRSERWRYVYTTKGDARFNGMAVTVVERRATSMYGYDSKSIDYYSLKGTSLRRHGERRGDLKAIFSPVQVVYRDLKVGESYSQKYSVKVSGDGDVPPHGEVSWWVKFDGFETITTKLGVLKTCKLSTKHVLRMDLSSWATRSNNIIWYVAEGPYRGLEVKKRFSGSHAGRSYNNFYKLSKVNTFSLR